jgi:hypothetical protein
MEHFRGENSQKLLEEINLWQVNDTVVLYESRIADLNEVLASSSRRRNKQTGGPSHRPLLSPLLLQRLLDRLVTQIQDRHARNVST